MKRNMKEWLDALRESPVKKAMPVLSFPAVQLMGISVRELISDSEAQAKGMALVAERTDAAAAVSLMDLSLEAECFGSTIRVSDDEVPTVTGALVTDEDEANALAVPAVGAGRTGIYLDAMRKALERISDRPVFAGVIGPFSLAARLLDVTEIMVDCYDEPDMVHIVMEKATAFLTAYCMEYKKLGANGVVIAEPVTGLLSPALAEEFSEPYVRRIVEAVQADRKGRRVTRKVREDYEQFMEAYNDISITMYESAISGTLEDELADIIIRMLDFCGMKGYSFDYRLITPEEYFMRDFTYFAWCLCRDILDRHEELVVWSVIKYCEKHGIDILWHIEQKMEYNKMRPRMHNAKY